MRIQNVISIHTLSILLTLFEVMLCTVGIIPTQIKIMKMPYVKLKQKNQHASSIKEAWKMNNHVSDAIM